MKNGMLNSNLKYMLARMGHRDLLAVTDAGYNIPRDMETVDVALLPNVPTIMQVIEAIQLEVPIEAVYLAEEIKVQAPDILEAYRAHFPDIEFQFLPHVPDFDQLVGTCKGAARAELRAEDRLRILNFAFPFFHREALQKVGKSDII